MTSEALNFQEVELQLSTGKIAGKWWRRGQGPLILTMHGWLDNANSFDALAEALPEQQLLCLDLPGHGHSSHRLHYNLWDYSFDIAELVKDHLDQPVFVVGHSLGGIVALFLPQLIPAHCLGLFTIDCLGPLVEEAEHWPGRLAQTWEHREKLRANSQTSYFFPSFESAVKRRTKSPVSPMDETRAAALMKRSLLETQDGWQLRSDRRLSIPSPLRLTEEHAKVLMGGVNILVDVVVATEGIGLHHYKQRFSYYRNSKVHHLAGDHHLHMKPEPARAIASLIQRRLQLIG